MPSRQPSRLLRVGLFAGALLLVPLSIGLARGLVWTERFYGRPDILGMSAPAAFFVIGFLAFAVLYAVVRIPAFFYVVGHELTHALFGMLVGARVSDWSVKAETGSVRITRPGILVLLSPYFVPLYMLAILAVFGVLSLLGPMIGTIPGQFFSFLCGAAWGFHFCFTVNNFMQRQTDLEAYGFFFSFVFVVTLNLLVLCLVYVALTRIDLRDMAFVCWDRIADTYLWFWDRFWSLIEGWRT
ncbi:MAG: hypothetical protein ACOX9C_11235 [Kiritimatiellia bacterium]|jgi:hypothetical protein